MSPRTTRQLDDIRNQRRQEILDAALELFAKQGYHNTSIEQIRKKAGVSKGLIYNYFDKKEDLVAGLINSELEQGDGFVNFLIELPDSAQRMRALIDMSFAYLINNLEHSKLVIQLSLQLDLDEFKPLKEAILARYTHMMPLMEALISDLGFKQPKKEALAATALLDGIAMQYIMLGDAINLESIQDYLIQRYCPDTSPIPFDLDNFSEYKTKP